MKTTLDNEFNKIPLFMYPWIGNNYENTKILFVGESEYADGVNFHLSWKREWIEKERILTQGKGSKILNNIDRTFLTTIDYYSDEYKKLQKEIWNNVAYTNLVQEAMEHKGNSFEKPTEKHIHDGWEALLKTILILKPKYIIKWGVLGETQLKVKINNKSFCDWNIKELDDHHRHLLLEHESGYQTKILFIRHPSRYYSPLKWSTYIKNFMPDVFGLLTGK